MVTRLLALAWSVRWYAMAVALVAAVVAVEVLAAPVLHGGAPAMLVVAAVLLAAAYGGLGPGLVTAFLATAITEALRLSAHRTPRPPVALIVEGLAFSVQSLGAAALMASLRASRLRARASARHIGAAYDMSAGLGEATTPREVADVILRHGLTAFETEAAAVYILEDGPDGRVLRLLAHVERDPRLLRFLPPFEAVAIDSELPPAIAARTRSTVSAGSRQEAATRYPALEPLLLQGLPPAFLCAPMLIEERLIGVLAGAYADEDQYRAVDMAWSLGLARECALAIDRTRMLESVRRARVQAEAASHAKDEFVATVSRALREPLTAIERGAQSMKECAVARRRWDEGIDAISIGLQNEQRVVDDILDLSRIVASDLPIRKGPVDFTRVVRACLDEARSTASEAGVSLTQGVRARRAMVFGDGERLRRIVCELLANAIRSTPSSGHVRLDLETSGGSARVRVSDDGRGIASTDLPHIFEPFYRTSRQRRSTRLGVGLAIAKHVADRHGGSLFAASAGEGRGAAFTLELPLWQGR
jgi:signal transduction histidine kinase